MLTFLRVAVLSNEEVNLLKIDPDYHSESEASQRGEEENNEVEDGKELPLLMRQVVYTLLLHHLNSLIKQYSSYIEANFVAVTYILPDRQSRYRVESATSIEGVSGQLNWKYGNH